MDKIMNTERENRLKLVEAHICEHRVTSELRDRREVSLLGAKPKARTGANKERQNYERFGF